MRKVNWEITKINIFLTPLWALAWCVPRSRFLSKLEMERAFWMAKRRPDDTLLASIATHYRVWSTRPSQALWGEAKKWLDVMETEPLRMNMASELARIYIASGRFDDARNASNYWLSTPAQWAREQPMEADKSLALHRRLWSWYGPLRPLPASVLFPEDKKAWQVMEQITTPDKRRWIQARDAYVALGFIRFLEVEARNGNHLFPKRSTRFERDPLLPQRARYDERFAQRIGMPIKTFNQIWREATQLDSKTLCEHST